MARGINSAGDLITTTIDGVDLNHLWDEFNRTIAMQNDTRNFITGVLSSRGTVAAEAVAQGSSLGDFEIATEYGEPVGIRATPDVVTMGYPQQFYDIAALLLSCGTPLPSRCRPCTTASWRPITGSCST